MSEIFFPNFDEVLMIHAEIIKETGGSEGLRDAGGLESALNAAKIALVMKPKTLQNSRQHTLFICRRHTLLLTETSAWRRSFPNCS